MALTERSYWWSTGTTNDGSTTFTQADLSEVGRILGACNGSVGVARGYLNLFAATIPGANNVQIDTGAAVVDGKPYSNLGAGNIAIPSAVGGGNTRIDRIVARADWANHQVRLTRIAGTDAASPSAPAITQTPGTTYDILLWQVTVNTTGVVTVTLDERTFAQPGTNEINTAAIQDSAVTAIKIANRTRTLYVPATNGVDGTTGVVPVYGDDRGFTLVDNHSSQIWGSFVVPKDYASGMTVQAILVAYATGNIYHVLQFDAGAAGANYNATPAAGALAAQAATITKNLLSTAVAVTPAVDDIVRLLYTRDATNVLDTVNASVGIIGFVVTYTADS